MIYTHLTDDGIVVTQSGSPYYQPAALAMAHKGMSEVFKSVKTYCAFIPTYPSGLWSFTMASSGEMKLRDEKAKSGKYFNSDILTCSGHRKNCFILRIGYRRWNPYLTSHTSTP